MKVILCEARHHHSEIEGLPSIFTNTISMDFASMDETASKFVKDNMAECASRNYLVAKEYENEKIIKKRNAFFDEFICFIESR